MKARYEQPPRMIGSVRVERRPLTERALAVLELLARGPASTPDVSSALGLHQPWAAASRLERLRERGLVQQVDAIPARWALTDAGRSELLDWSAA